MSLIPVEDLVLAYQDYLRNRPKTKAEILCEIAREDNTSTVQELATAAEQSPAWVRKTLKQAGIVLVKPLRQHAVAGAANMVADNRPYPAVPKAEGAADDAPAPAKRQGFVYRPRTLEQWAARVAHGSRRGRRQSRPRQ